MDTFQGVVALLRYLLPILVFGTSVYFVRRFILALEKRASNNLELAQLRERIAALEEGQDTTERDVLRLQAANEFAAQLLADRFQALPDKQSK